MKKSILTFGFSFLLFLLTSLTIKAQEWDWNGTGYNETVKEYVWGTIQQMKLQGNCSRWNYGKSALQKVFIYSWSKDDDRYRIRFQFTWHIDYMFGGSNDYSYTVKVSSDRNGCHAQMTYENSTGGPDCSYSSGRMYDLGCLTGSGR